MRFEPFGQEGLRSFVMSNPTANAIWRFVVRSRSGWMLIAFGLIVGFGVGSGIGSAENAPSARRNVLFASAGTLGSNDSNDAFHPAEDELETGEIVAQYVSVSIDSLPIHRPVHARRTLDSLTIVTRGEIGSGESLGSSMRRQGISPGTVHLIATEMRKVFDFRRSRPGDHYRLGQDSEGRVLDFRYAQGPEESFYLSWNGTRYVVRKETAELRPQIAKIAGIVDSSFYGAILALGEQSSLATEFARIFAWDIDFSRNVHPGDEFQILYERLYRRNDDGDDVYVRPGRILAGRYDGNVGQHTIVYFEDENAVGGYFRPDGSSVERAFLVAPLAFSRISSRFTRARRHPILNVTRPHPGIDYAAPVGTPIWAVADGVVEYRARAGASGNLVRIRHIGGYTSHYAHLSGFAKNLSVGDKVEQKQIIGYVGNTGLSTGPHVCFRVKKNGSYVDPMRIASPAGLPVDGHDLLVFRNVRDRLLADLGPGPLNVTDEAL
jgi:murein DD-endopeptidase MepM/ murein hydrolase activator NlpD